MLNYNELVDIKSKIELLQKRLENEKIRMEGVLFSAEGLSSQLDVLEEYYSAINGVNEKYKIKTCEQLNEIFKNVLYNVEKIWDINFPVEITADFQKEKKIKKGMIQDSEDNEEDIITGYSDKKGGKFVIYILKNSDLISVSSTIAYELAHIWQKTNRKNTNIMQLLKSGHKKDTNNSKDAPDEYEGLARWAEVQYLYFMGETMAAMKEERNLISRADPVGRGFLKYANNYPFQKKYGKKNDNPFKTESK